MGLWQFIQNFIQRLKSKYKLPMDTYCGFDIMKYYLNRWGTKTCQSYIMDDKYFTIKKSDVERVLDLNLFRFRKWKKQTHDCDNFALNFLCLMKELYPSHAFGMVFVHTGGLKHALNCFVDQFGKVWYIEPQNNKVFQNDKYKPYMVLI